MSRSELQLPAYAERHRFEEWAHARKHDLSRNSNNDYANKMTNECWLAWLAGSKF